MRRCQEARSEVNRRLSLGGEIRSGPGYEGTARRRGVPPLCAVGGAPYLADTSRPLRAAHRLVGPYVEPV